MFGDIVVTTGGGTGGEQCPWHLVGRGRDAAKHPTRHKTVPTTENYPARDADSAKAQSLLCSPVSGACMCLLELRGSQSESTTLLSAQDTRIRSNSQIDHHHTLLVLPLGRAKHTAFPVCLAKCQWRR